MALCALGQTELAHVAEFVDDVAPIRRLLMQLDPVESDRAIDLRFEAGTIMLRASTGLGAQAIRFVDHQRDELRHAFERRGLVGRQGRQREEVLQERSLQRQRILAAHLQVEDVELMPGHELQRDENRLVPPLRAECLLDQPHEALGGLPDIRLADQRQLRAVGSHHGRAEAQPDIDRIGQHRFARTGRGDEDVDNQRALASAGGVIGPDAAVRAPEQHAAAVPRRRRAVPGEHRERVAQQREGGVCGRCQGQTWRRAHRALKGVADYRGCFGVAPALDALRQAWTSAGAAWRPPRPAPRSRNLHAGGR